MNSVGSLSVAARFAEGRLSGLSVQLERPPVAKLFIGQRPEAVARTVPYLYTLCAHAQGAACRGALAAAAGEAPPPADSAALWAEALHEHFWRLLLDWPLALGLPQAKDAFIAWRGARTGGGIVAATAALLENTLLGCPPAAWQEGEATAVPSSLAGRCLERLGRVGKVAAFETPPLTPGDWLAYWRTEGGSPPATARPASVGAAWRARLRETVAAARALESGAAYPVAVAGGDGWGVGQTLTARGVLTHGVRIVRRRVAAYRVWAPTDCHFADASGLAVLLRDGTWPDGAAAKRAVEQAVLALDPCLPYTVRVNDA
ncbi:MAG: hypothetical protein H6R10_2681 [Rhodocyclaceae bacterium]|nr:hypothetical protein [Rhodocyclaceae bacterium]